MKTTKHLFPHIFSFIVGTIALILAPTHVLAKSPTDRDKQLMEKLAQGNRAEIELAKTVVQKASNSSVKNFAQRMIADHTTLLGQSQDWAVKNHVSFTTKLGNQEQAEKAKLSALSGNELDRQYILNMLEDHKKDVSEIAEYIITHPDSGIRTTLEQTLPVIENHLRIAENIAGQLGIGPEAGLLQPEHPSSS